MKTINLIEYAVKKGFQQKQIAEHLGVSNTQVNKWKTKEDIPYEREQQILKFIGLGDSLHLEWIGITENRKKQEKWCELFEETARDGNPYQGAWFFEEGWQEATHYVTDILKIFKFVCIEIPEDAPEYNYDNEDDDYSKEEELLNFIYSYMREYMHIIGWYILNQEELDENIGLDNNIYTNIEHYAPRMAFRAIEPELLKTLNADEEKIDALIKKSTQDLRKEITEFIKSKQKKGCVLTSNLFHVLHYTNEGLGDLIMESSINYPLVDKKSDIEKYMSVGEQTLFQSLEEAHNGLKFLHKKIDLLMKKQGCTEKEITGEDL